MTGALSRITLAAALALAIPATASEPRSQPATSRGISPAAKHRDQVLGVARRIMTAARYCTLVTLGEKQRPQARVMDPLPPDSSLAVYIATNPKSRKVAEIRRDSRVTLLYFDAAGPAYVTLIGEALEIPNPEKRTHYKDEWQAFFPREDSDSYTLYRIVASRVEVLSPADGLSGDPGTWRPEIVDLN